MHSILSAGSQNADLGQAAFQCKAIRPKFNLDKLEIRVGNIPLDVLVDSGSQSNVISKDTFDLLVSRGLRAKVEPTDLELFPYTADKPLDLFGCFNAELEAGNQWGTAEIIIINDRDQTSLLSNDTSHALKLIKIGYNVGVNSLDSNTSNVSNYGSLLDNYKNLFSGVGKFKGPDIKIGIRS